MEAAIALIGLIIIYLIIFIIIAVSTIGTNITIHSMEIIQEQQGKIIIKQNGEIIELLNEMSKQNKKK